MQLCNPSLFYASKRKHKPTKNEKILKLHQRIGDFINAIIGNTNAGPRVAQTFPIPKLFSLVLN